MSIVVFMDLWSSDFWWLVSHLSGWLTVFAPKFWARGGDLQRPFVAMWIEIGRGLYFQVVGTPKYYMWSSKFFLPQVVGTLKPSITFGLLPSLPAHSLAPCPHRGGGDSKTYPFPSLAPHTSAWPIWSKGSELGAKGVSWGFLRPQEGSRDPEMLMGQGEVRRAKGASWGLPEASGMLREWGDKGKQAGDFLRPQGGSRDAQGVRGASGASWEWAGGFLRPQGGSRDPGMLRWWGGARGARWGWATWWNFHYLLFGICTEIWRIALVVDCWIH